MSGSWRRSIKSPSIIADGCRHWSAALADTLSSELGILSLRPPILITTGKPVRAGTNGGISMVGTQAAAVGGALIGMAAVLSTKFCGAQNVIAILSCSIYGIIGSLVCSLQ